MADETKKKEVALDRADPAESGGWFFLKGTDAIRLLRSFARWDACSRIVGIVLLGVCAFYLRELTLVIMDLAYAMKGNPK